MEHLIDAPGQGYSTLQLFSKVGLEQPIKDIISKLLFISKINVGEKLNVRDYFVRDNNSVSQRLIRTVKNWTSQDSGEYKKDTLKFLQGTITEALELIFIYYPKKLDFSGTGAESRNRTIRSSASDLNPDGFQSDDRKKIMEFNKSIALLIIKNIEESKKGMDNLKQTYTYDRNFCSDLQALIQTLEIKLNSIVNS